VALTYATLPGDIDHLIADDHAVVERQLQHLEAGRGDRRVLVDQISAELALHAFAEETVLYPLWHEAGMTDQHDEAEHVHQQIKDQLAVLGRTEPGELEFERALARLIRLTRHHVEDEESSELPEFRATAGPARMAELGEKFLAAKRRSGTRKEMGTDPSGLLRPQAQAIVDAHAALGPLPLEILEPEQARKQPGPDDAVRLVLAGRGIDQPEPVGSVEDLVLPGQLRLRVYRPEEVTSGLLPVLMWVHGGGWVVHDVETSDATCRGLCTRTGAVVVGPGYRRAPEAVFPAAHDDVLRAWRWVRENAGTLGGDAERMAIGGEEAGATTAAATALHLGEVGEPRPVALVLACPLATPRQLGDSAVDAADARPLNRPLLSWMLMHAFRGVPEGLRDRRVDLLSWTGRELSQMPLTLVVTAERDPLRNQGWQFAGMLTAAGVDARELHCEGVMHGFLGAAAVLDEAGRIQQHLAAHLRQAFGAARPAVGAA
jgi:acetyl esterase/lipase